MNNNDENSKENSNAHEFCVPTGYAKSHYDLSTEDLKSLEHRMKGGRYYGGLFKLYQPAALEALVAKKYGKDYLKNKRQKEVDEHNARKERELEKERFRALARKRQLPERPVCAGELYRREHRAAFRKKHRGEGKSDTEIDKLINQQFRSIPLQERRVFTQKAKAYKERYAKLEQERNETMAREKPTDLCVYVPELYRRDHRSAFREKYPQETQKEIDRMINKQFKLISHQERQSYQDKSRANKAINKKMHEDFDLKWNV